MLPSPSSSLSSFRDYYQHTSEGSEEPEVLIHQGLLNFKVAKAFSRLAWKVRQEHYWACFHAFSAIKAQHSRRSQHAAAITALKKVLKRRAYRESKLALKSEYLGELINNVKEKRRIELMRMIGFGMLLMRNRYIKASMCRRIMIYFFKYRSKKHNSKEDDAKKEDCKKDDHKKQDFKKEDWNKQDSKKENEEEGCIPMWKYNFRLRRARLAICFRNICSKKYIRSLMEFLMMLGPHLKYSDTQKQISFFRPKREKVYEHRKDAEKSDILFHAAKIAQILQKKHYISLRTFFKNITIPVAERNSSLQDSPEIWAYVTQHMIYLTGTLKHQTKETNSQRSQLRLFKFGQILKKDRRRVREGMRDCLTAWRKAANEQHLMLRRDILKLQMIKKHYMDEF